MIPQDAEFWAKAPGGLLFGRQTESRFGFHVDEVDGLSVGEVQEVGVAEYDGTGQHDLPNTIRDPRLITISGIAAAPSMAELGRFEDIGRACLLEKTASGKFSWFEYGRTRWCDVRRYRGWRFRRIGSTGNAEYTARFRAPSQLVYGETVRVGPGVTLAVENRGQYPASPVVTVTGSLPSGYRVNAGGRSYVVIAALAAGQVHRIDMRTGLLYLNGVPQVGASSAPRKLTAPRGVTVFTLTYTAGGGQMTVEHHSPTM